MSGAMLSISHKLHVKNRLHCNRQDHRKIFDTEKMKLVTKKSVGSKDKTGRMKPTHLLTMLF
jgi:hypothetical protein